MIVVDASVVVEFLLDTPTGDRVWSRISDPEATLHAPHLLDLEVAQVLRRFVARGDLSDPRAQHAVEALRDLRARRYPHLPLLPRIWELRANLTSYDAAYVALAESLDAPLLTADARLAKSPGLEIAIELF